MKIVEVVWDDAHVSTGETTLKRAGKMKAVRTHTIGYLASENEEGLVLMMDRFDKTPKAGRVYTFIPHGMVVRQTELVDDE